MNGNASYGRRDTSRSEEKPSPCGKTGCGDGTSLQSAYQQGDGRESEKNDEDALEELPVYMPTYADSGVLSCGAADDAHQRQGEQFRTVKSRQRLRAHRPQTGQEEKDAEIAAHPVRFPLSEQCVNPQRRPGEGHRRVDKPADDTGSYAYGAPVRQPIRCRAGTAAHDDEADDSSID